MVRPITGNALSALKPRPIAGFVGLKRVVYNVVGEAAHKSSALKTFGQRCTREGGRLLRRVLRWLTTPLFIISFLTVLLWPSHQKVIYGEPVSPHPPLHKVSMAVKLAESPLQPVPEAEPVYVAPPPVIVPVASTVAGCGDNFYANYIYMHESTCNLYSVNASSGACGIGQAWPCSKLLAICSLSDYACQNQFFTDYANGMGGWAAAYSIWISKGWW